jgi:hypothetical protein
MRMDVDDKKDDATGPDAPRVESMRRRAGIVLVVLAAFVVFGSAYGAFNNKQPDAVSSVPAVPVAPAAPTPATPATGPIHAVGDVVDADGNKIGVISAKIVDQTLAVRLYVKSTAEGADLSSFDDSNFMVVNTDGASYAGEIAPGDLPDLDTSGLGVLDDFTDGWVGFPVNGAIDQLTLVVRSPAGGSDLSISLAGATHASSKNAAATALSRDTKAAAAAYEAATVTMNDYRRVKNGMSLRAVQKILGYKGEEVSSSGAFTMWSWSNDFDGSNMIVTFYHGRVQSKAQAGL